MPDQFDAVVAGAGIIGASIAWRLARQNVRVLLLDAATVGGEASSAAAGMLTPGGEFDDPAMRELAIHSLALYPDFVREIVTDSGLSVDFRQTGTIEFDAPVRPGSRPLPRGELRRLAPLARADAASAIFFPSDAVVDPAALMRALRAACIARGVCLREGSPVAGIDVDSKAARIAGVRARFAILAAGAWSSAVALRLNGQPYTPPRSFPVKGHLLGYRLPPGSLPVTVRQEHTYVLQRADGFTIAGSSAENAGFDRSIDPKIVSDIAARASALVPSLQSLKPESVWIGFRPAIDAPAPQIGPVPSPSGDASRLWLAYGHYRNGILLAPVTAGRISRELAAAAALE
jgi:glycine oxidase